MPQQYYFDPDKSKIIISDRALDDTNLISTEELPNNGNYIYDGLAWVQKSEVEEKPLLLSVHDTDPITNPDPGHIYLYQLDGEIYSKNSLGVIKQISGVGGGGGLPAEVELFQPSTMLKDATRIINLVGSGFVNGTKIFVLRGDEQQQIEANKITFYHGGSIEFELSAGPIAGELGIIIDNGSGETTVNPAITVEDSDWQFLGTGGINFTHGNEAAKDIRYRSTMALHREADGIWFAGTDLNSSWIKFEFKKWNVSEGRTLKVIFSITNENMTMGICGEDIDENATNFQSEAEVQFYIPHDRVGAVIWQGSWNGIQNYFTTNYHRLEIQSNGDAGEIYRFYDLPDGTAESWDNLDTKIVEGIFPTRGRPNPDVIMPFFTLNGMDSRIIAIQVG